MEHFPMKKATRILVPLLLAFFIIASIFWYLFVYDRGFTRDTLLGQARFHDLHGNSRMSAWFYNMAYDFSGKDENVAIELANQYISSGNYTKAEATLTQALTSAPTTDLYAALCQTYVAQDKLLDAVNLLDSIVDPTILAEITSMRPTAPAADYASGYYSQYMDIHLSSSAKTIFYTLDGDYPSIAGMQYDSFITLPTGETQVHAISVDQNGLVSPLTLLNYTITGIIEEVVFTDSAIEAAIREQINASSTKSIYTNELWDITEFTVPEGAATFNDLTLMPYLENLTLQNHTLDNLGFLSTLTKLETLDLTGCQFPSEDLSILANLPVLSRLTLADCSLSTISGLAGANALSYLDLSSNTVRNLEVLTPMTTLIEINLQHNAVTELKALSGLVNLEKLNVGFNVITDLSPLTGCAKLNWLDASNNQISQLSGVNTLPLLTYLSLEENTLSDVSILSSNTELKNLNIGSNTITDISALRTLTKLETFNFSSNQISALPEWPDGCVLQSIDGSYNALTSIDGLKNMQSLTYVYMDYNLLTNIDAIAECFCLVQVNVFGNQISDVSKLRAHDIIVNYDPTVA